MADPIPRNSRADETAEYRRAVQERRGNRPLFGEGIGGGLRARIENAQQQQARPNPVPNPFARPAQAQPQARPVPPPLPRANPRAVPPEQAARDHIVDVLRRGVDAVRQARPPQAHRYAPRPRPVRTAIASAAAFGLFMAVLGGRAILSPPQEVVPDAASQLPAAAAPMIPAPAPAEVCSATLTDAAIDPDEQMSDTRRALISRVVIDANGCNGQMLRVAVWVFQAENQPLLAPGADPVYRSPLAQLTVQTLVLVDGPGEQIETLLALPHMQFPTDVGSPRWLTVGVQVWPEGRPAPAGSMIAQQVYFTRAE